MKHQKLLSYIRRAVDDYNMIEEGDKIAVGLSGGKDSISLLLGLNSLKMFYPKHFDIAAVTVSLGFPNCDFSPIRQLCRDIGVRYEVVDTDIGQIVFLKCARAL